MSWHVPCPAEIDFSVELFRELVEPTLVGLEALLEERMPMFQGNSSTATKGRYTAAGSTHNGVWRNDFCRFVLYYSVFFICELMPDPAI